ncbi:hypothetical protein DPMN_119748 [Dreissena polymorpha]|uniref:Uncharacterized protein n=1 Tax=Dreissena polymorpha TaxID=45954 RepID=A0A9D4JS73_DREPO|nr:hypothetical protein DPMN_119748 [Dreissena polymorpha]
MNLLTKFHEDRTVNVASRVKNVPPLGSHTNLLTKFHEDSTINVASRVLTREKCPAPGSHVFQATRNIFDLIQDIIETNLLTKFLEDRKINVVSSVLTRKMPRPPGGHFHKDWTINVASRVKNAPPLGSHVLQAKVTIFKLIQDIIGKNLLTKFHEDRKINVASRARPPGGHFF